MLAPSERRLDARAPPEKRRRQNRSEGRKRRNAGLHRRRKKNRDYQRDWRARRKKDLHRVALYISGRAYEGLIRQLILMGQLTDNEANDHRRFEAALAALNEAQGRKWAR